jgi:hypothetical protein
VAVEWGQSIGPALLLALGALLKWVGDVSKASWDERRKARRQEEDREDLLHRSRRVLLDEIGRLRALCRRHNVPEEQIGPVVHDPWDERRE